MVKLAPAAESCRFPARGPAGATRAGRAATVPATPDPQPGGPALPLVPAVPARPAAPEAPLVFEAPLAYEDRVAGNLHAQRGQTAAQRRRTLTIGLPLVWFLGLLGAVSIWATAGGRRTPSTLWRDASTVDALPLGLYLVLVTGILLASYATHPWLAWRRMRAAMGPPGGDGPVRVSYRFDGAGLTQTLPDFVSFAPWSRLDGLDEDPRYLFIATGIGSTPIVLPKAHLGPAEAEGVRAWVRACAGRPLAPAPPAEAEAPPAPGAVRVALRLNPEDRAAIILRTLNNPWARRARLTGALMWFLALSLLYPVLLAGLWAIDPYRVPFGTAFPLFLEMARTDFWQPALGVAVLVGLVLAVHSMLRRGMARDLGRTLEAEALPGEAHLIIDEGGIATTYAGAHARFGWSQFKGRERVGDLVILPMRWDDVLPLPLRVLDAPARARFEALAERHLPQETRAR